MAATVDVGVAGGVVESDARFLNPGIFRKSA